MVNAAAPHTRDDAKFRRDLLRAISFNVAIALCPSNNAGHAVSGQIRLGYITLEPLVREGATWGMDEEDARQTAVSALESVAEAAART